MGSAVDYFCIFMLWMSSTISVAAYRQQGGKMGAIGLGGVPWGGQGSIPGPNSMAPNVQPHGAASPRPSPRRHPSRHPHPPPRPHLRRHHRADPEAPSNKMNEGQKIGLVLASFAGLLQVAVVVYLLVKRRQMLRIVEKYDV